MTPCVGFSFSARTSSEEIFAWSDYRPSRSALQWLDDSILRITARFAVHFRLALQFFSPWLGAALGCATPKCSGVGRRCTRRYERHEMATASRSAIQPSATGFWRFVPWMSRLVMFPPVIIFTLIMLRYVTNPAHAISGTILTTPKTLPTREWLAHGC